MQAFAVNVGCFMHSYLRAIGYSRIQSRTDEEKLIRDVVEQAAQFRLASLNEKTAFVEHSKECTEFVGVTVRGELDMFLDIQGEKFHAEHYFPYLYGNCISLQDRIYVSKKVDTDAYHGMCEDSRVGVSLIFYLQNAVDYLKRDASAGMENLSVSLSALSLGGHILLPVAEQKPERELIQRSGTKRAELVAEAKKGNQEAMESLTMEDFDLYTMITERARKEDIYSIVDTTFIPYGTESDVYTILARIEDYRYVTNKETGEELCLMQLCCNNMQFDLCINREDLWGEPDVGRRFRGTIWLQGRVDFV